MPVEQPPSLLPAAITLVVGVGERGGRIVKGLAHRPPFSPQDDDPRRHLGRITLLDAQPAIPTGQCAEGGQEIGRTLARKIGDHLERMLTHTSVDDARRLDGAWVGSKHPTEALVLVVADVGEEAVRDCLNPMLRSLEDHASEKLSPIFSHWAGNLTVLPILSTPHVPSAAASLQIGNCLHTLHEQVRSRERARRLISTFYVMEGVTDLSVLQSEDIDAVVETYCLALAEALGSNPRKIEGVSPALRTGNTLEHILRTPQPDQPLGTFSAARIETGLDDIREYLRCNLALRTLEAVHGAEVSPEGVAGRDETKSNVMVVLERNPPGNIAERAREIVSQASLQEDEAPPWYRFKPGILAKYGPDRGDPTVDGDQSRGEDEGWIRSAADHVLGTWRRLIGSAFDGLVDEFRTNLAEWEFGKAERKGIREALRDQIDHVLLPAGKPTVNSYREATRRAALILEEARIKLYEAVAARDLCVIENDPSLKPLRAAHTGLLCKTRAIPSLDLLLAGCSAAALAVTALLAPVFEYVGRYNNLEPGSLGEFIFVKLPFLPAGTLAVILCGLVGIGTFLPRYRRALEAFQQLREEAHRLIFGASGSVMSFFLGRLNHAWHLNRTGVLVRACEAAERELERLRQIDRALVGAMDRYKQRLVAIGVIRQHGRSDDVSGFFGAMRKPLVWPLLTPETIRKFVDSQKEIDVTGVLKNAETLNGIYSRWREELPFLDDRWIDAALDGIVESGVPNPPWKAGEMLREEAIRGLADFARNQDRSLPVGLPFRGHEFRAPDGIQTVANWVLLPEACRDLLGKQLADVALRDVPFVLLGERAETDRVYALRIFNGIDPKTIDWWPASGSAGPNPQTPADTTSTQLSPAKEEKA